MLALPSMAALLIVSTLTFVQAHARNENPSKIVPAASTFYLPETETQFSINIADDSSDVYFYFASPANSWVGIGFGQQMEDSLMMVMYLDGRGRNVTISPRIGRKAGEPTYTEKVEIEVLDGTRVEDDMMILHARCSDCRVWPNGFLDATSPSQPMMYAFGSAYTLQSSSLSANLKRHVRYGHFVMDMTAATGTGGVPLKSSMIRGVQMQGGVIQYTDGKNIVHAILGCLVLFVIWPVSAFIAGFWRCKRVHVGFLVAILPCLAVVYGLGISTSYQYNRSRPFTSPHQLLSLISSVPLLALLFLPTRLLFPIHSSIQRLHNPLSILTLILLLISGGLGLHLSSQSRTIVLVYTALSLLLIFFLALLAGIVRRRSASGREGALRLAHTGSSVLELRLGFLGKESRFGSEAGSATNLRVSLAESRRDMGVGASMNVGVGGSWSGDGAQQQKRVFGGGVMPGPQYLLNMHPGVPVRIGSGRI